MSAEVLKTYINDLKVHRPIPQERRSATKKAAMRYLIEDRNAVHTASEFSLPGSFIVTGK